ncbi:lytB domain-containing protein, putative [Eimeria maxima]|uniref:4-hydroxy-3-methylbut-2-enyl diphosphate reductase n=1 Tax=Eimeria maxima TaxID=5804 RepID=U6M4U9_EIMMA|nr:lytB domain-containing protein, putative [Eimeria maxima]CDJ59031.1 lytB domain-containing protein, putative [Eimeria maxima]
MQAKDLQTADKTETEAEQPQKQTAAAIPEAAAAPATAATAARRFGAAPLAAAVFAEAEVGAAAAAATADAAAAAESGPVALVAAPRGFCEGVRRAVGTVEEALKVFGPPVYVHHQIVHNEFVCKQLEVSRKSRNCNSRIVCSAGVSFAAIAATGPSSVGLEVRKAAKERNLTTIDATCPLVQKVHVYVHQKAQEGYHIIVIGHKDHVEVHGVCGEAPGRVHVVESSDDAHLLPFSAEDKLFYVTQTTLSVMDCLHIETELKTRYPNIETIKSGSVCYATYNRQAALGALAAHAQLAIVVGSRSSSNALRLVEIAKSKGIPAYLVGDADDVDPHWLAGVKRVVISASASTPEELTKQIMNKLKAFNVQLQIEANAVNEKKPVWKLPKSVQALQLPVCTADTRKCAGAQQPKGYIKSCLMHQMLCACMRAVADACIHAYIFTSESDFLVTLAFMNRLIPLKLLSYKHIKITVLAETKHRASVMPRSATASSYSLEVLDSFSEQPAMVF